jgi:pyruvate, water dikinase
MTWLRYLDEIRAADLPQVGYKAYYLGLLGQKQLPIVAGQVLTAEAWQATLAHVHGASSFPMDALMQLDVKAFQALQRVSQQCQQTFRAVSLPMPLVAELEPWPHPTWMLRASVWLDVPLEEAQTMGCRGLLPAQIRTTATSTLPQALHRFWEQALTARSLVVWQRHCQRITDLKLATLIMPVGPALASGTLTIKAGMATCEAVLGLGLPLSRGEAIPARCRVNLAQPGAVVWEPGFQEQMYQVATALGSQVRTQSLDLPLQVTPRETPELVDPLSPDQLFQLLTLGQQAHAILAEHQTEHSNGRTQASGIGLKWLLCPSLESTGWELRITQAIPHLSLTKASRTPAPAQPLGSYRSSMVPPPLPAISTVVRGIGASSGQVQGVAVVATRPQDLPKPLPPNAIVVLPDLQPDVFLQLEAVAGIVTERGGATCHAAILAREIGIPAVVGAPQATQLLESETVLWLDGDRGVVYGLDQDVLLPHRAQPLNPVDPAPAPTSAFFAEQSTRYSTLRTKVMANLSQIRRLSALPIDHIAGIGLLRSEWLLLDILDGRHPWHWVNQGQEAELTNRIVQQLEPVLKLLGPKPLRYRSLDLRSHEWQALEGSPPLEPNPMLGLRGTLSYDVDARLFQVELAALATLQQAGYTNLQLILPFVRTVEEVLTCRQHIRQAGLTDYNDFALWIMAEVPSVLFLLPAYAQAGVQGIAIGSNDLTQLLLAVDRDQPTMASAYDERHPVVQMAMAHLVKEARRCGMTCSICGQAPVRHPDLIADLVAWGINSISVEASALPFTLEAVWQAEQKG